MCLLHVNYVTILLRHRHVVRTTHANGLRYATAFISTSTSLLPRHLVAAPSGIYNSNPSPPFNHPHFPAPTPMNNSDNYLLHSLDIIYYITPPSVVNTTIELCLKMCYINVRYVKTRLPICLIALHHTTMTYLQYARHG